jgi:hypothetical protein
MLWQWCCRPEQVMQCWHPRRRGGRGSCCAAELVTACSRLGASTAPAERAAGGAPVAWGAIAAPSKALASWSSEPTPEAASLAHISCSLLGTNPEHRGWTPIDAILRKEGALGVCERKLDPSMGYGPSAPVQRGSRGVRPRGTHKNASGPRPTGGRSSEEPYSLDMGEYQSGYQL